ncbi:hypothetical protein ACFV1N_27370 [Streptosporangium canum]|uniref:hypothetical protein n=1 Tax=Streptosporangium canum TaxID=324952 RepID=UPI003693D41A
MLSAVVSDGVFGVHGEDVRFRLVVDEAFALLAGGFAGSCRMGGVPVILGMPDESGGGADSGRLYGQDVVERLLCDISAGRRGVPTNHSRWIKNAVNAMIVACEM